MYILDIFDVPYFIGGGAYSSVAPGLASEFVRFQGNFTFALEC